MTNHYEKIANTTREYRQHAMAFIAEHAAAEQYGVAPEYAAALADIADWADALFTNKVTPHDL